MATLPTNIETVRPWMVEEGDVLLDLAGDPFSVTKVDADLQEHGGFVAIWHMPGSEGRMLYAPDAEIPRIASGRAAREPLAPWAKALIGA